MKTKADRLNEAIENMSSVCPQGKKEVRALVEVITAEDLSPKKEPERFYHIGSRFKFNGRVYLIAVASSEPRRIIAINVDTGARLGGGNWNGKGGVLVDSWYKITEAKIAEVFMVSYLSGAALHQKVAPL